MDMDQVMNKLDELKQNGAETEEYEKVLQKCEPYRTPLPPLSQKIRDNYPFFGLSGAIYAVFFTFCLYKNSSGITAPLFAIGTLCYFFLCLRKLEIRIGKECIFYAGSIVLLGINLCLTDDGFLIFCDYFGIILLLLSGLLHLFYEDREWGLMEYLSAIVQTAFGAGNHLERSFEDGKIWKNRKKTEENREGKQKMVLKYVLLGILTGLPLLVVVMLLLASADSVFGHLLDVFNVYNILKRLFGVGNVFRIFGDLFGICFMTLAVYLLSYGLLVNLAGKSVKISSGQRRTGEPVIAITVNAMLGVVYLIFSMIQILYLFMGRLSLPEGTTYAVYARQGFFQLLLVCIINMTLVLFCLYKFRESRVLKGMLALISGCTYIMIASSALRMYMYVETYDLSYLRVLVFWGLGLIFLIMCGIMLFIFNRKFPLFKYCMVAVTILYLGLAYARPDYLIASYNLNEQHIHGNVDWQYLRIRSADAVPAFVEAWEREKDNDPEDELADIMASLKYIWGRDEAGLRGFNFSRYYVSISLRRLR